MSREGGEAWKSGCTGALPKRSKEYGGRQFGGVSSGICSGRRYINSISEHPLVICHHGYLG